MWFGNPALWRTRTTLIQSRDFFFPLLTLKWNLKRVILFMFTLILVKVEWLFFIARILSIWLGKCLELKWKKKYILVLTYLSNGDKLPVKASHDSRFSFAGYSGCRIPLPLSWLTTTTWDYNALSYKLTSENCLNRSVLMLTKRRSYFCYFWILCLDVRKNLKQRILNESQVSPSQDH